MRLKENYLIKNNKGLSLVELIVVIAIMAVMIGGGGFTISMLSGAEAKQAVQKFSAQLNDVKTGTMTKADEEMVIRYINVTDTNKESFAKKGVDTSGFYADKCIYTIMNNASDPSKSIRTAYNDTHEYSHIGSKKVTITIYAGGASYELTGDEAEGYLFSYNRKTGAFEEAKTVAVTGDTLTIGSSIGKLEKIEFKCGLRTYTLTIDAEAGRHYIE